MKRIMMIGSPYAPLLGFGGGSPSSIGTLTASSQWSRDATTKQAYYQVASGDTLSSIARTWLGDGQLWRQLWDYQSIAFKTAHKNDPNLLLVGDKLAMPQTAIAKAESMGYLPAYAVTTREDGSVLNTLPVITITAGEAVDPQAPTHEVFLPKPETTTTPEPTATSSPEHAISPAVWALVAGGAAVGAVLLYRQSQRRRGRAYA